MTMHLEHLPTSLGHWLPAVSGVPDQQVIARSLRYKLISRYLRRQLQLHPCRLAR
jgi:hypothetical protein